ncbi:bifunctional 3-(3-hydroxy-phenyl)propionate/3-hydroxycinnamic acid hydroxylase [Flavobacterium crassostreae]|uniref:FAD-binding domain-containing protein n=1 Tax=Flavobacterium crassostreae TaxID=1763534 RepID=A0A1B9E5Z0_9FLAO|nr:bifunctional 3-(3-hydroxy-phenyl)propionate/3-hydroxycinnamic acid hydroxylase [Flavobacterium crassostreae]OCB77382.1 hypothetical protein LPBF_05190 [Flavobacterium crassostreae]
MNNTFDVVIVGCGPTGATFANYFGLLGLRVLLLDKESDIIDYPRAVHIDEDVIRIFQELGLYDKMKVDAIKPFKNYSLVSKKDKILFQFQPNSSISEDVSDCNWILQPEIEKHLRNGFLQYPNVTFLKNTSWTEIQQNKEEVCIQIQDQHNIETRVRAKFLIACDGGKSLVRKKMNLSVTDFGFKKEWLVIDTKYKGNTVFSEDHKQYCDPIQPMTYVNGVRDHFRWEFMVSKKDSLLSEEVVSKKMISKLAATYPLDDFEIIRKKKYVFHTLIANQWRSERVFLAGDAAHQMPPFLGQGMCSGIKDAKNLAWKIHKACNNYQDATSELLDTYYSERAPQVKKIIKMAAILGGFIQYSNPILSPLRNGILKLFHVLPNQPIDRLIEKHLYGLEVNNFYSKKHALVGKRLPQPKIKHSDGVGYFDAICGFNWVVLYLSNSEIKPSQVTPWIKHVAIVSHTPTETNQIKSSYFEKWMQDNKVDFVIIRPDKFIFNLGKAKNYPTISALTNQYVTKISSN